MGSITKSGSFNLIPLDIAGDKFEHTRRNRHSPTATEASGKTLVATAGSIALAACEHLGVSLGSSRAYYRKLGQHGGVSSGDRANILKETTTLKVYVKADSVLGIVRRVLPQTGEVAEAQVRLSDMRNDYAHGRLDPAQVKAIAIAGV